MNIIKRLLKSFSASNKRFLNVSHVYSKGSIANRGAMSISAVYRCVDTISDGVAQLPIKVYNVEVVNGRESKTRNYTHPAVYVLNTEPHRRYTRFTFVKTMVVSMLLRGNAYALINRNERGQVVSLEYINADDVTIKSTDNGDLIYYINGRGNVESCNIIHVLNFSYDGITGVSTLTHARNTLELASDSDIHATNFFKGGANLAGYLKVNKTLTANQKKQIKDSWVELMQTGGNSIAVLEGDMDYTPVTISPADAQLLQSREFNVVEICRFFNVSPVKVFDLTKSSYSTVEATQLAFLTDTIAPLLSKFELEFYRKIFLPSERGRLSLAFDTSVLLRADKNALSNYYRNMFNIGVLTPNEVREQNDLPPIDGGDEAFLQSNITTIKNINNNETK